MGHLGDLFLEVVVAVEPDLLVHLHHHRFNLLQLVTDVRQVLLLLEIALPQPLKPFLESIVVVLGSTVDRFAHFRGLTVPRLLLPYLPPYLLGLGHGTGLLPGGLLGHFIGISPLLEVFALVGTVVLLGLLLF